MHRDNNEYIFEKIFDSIQEFAASKPFEPSESVSYGLIEVCTHAAVEFFDAPFLHFDMSEFDEWYFATLKERIGEMSNGLIAIHELVYDQIVSTLQSIVDDEDFDGNIAMAALFCASFHSVFPHLSQLNSIDDDVITELFSSPKQIIYKLLDDIFISDAQLNENVFSMASFLTKEHYEDVVKPLMSII